MSGENACWWGSDKLAVVSVCVEGTTLGNSLGKGVAMAGICNELGDTGALTGWGGD